MAQLIVRNLEQKLVRKLRLRAAKNGVSVEEEHRRILREALLSHGKSNFADYLLSIPTGTKNEPPELFERQRDLPREMEL